jgi:hypothetical protein
LSWLQLLPRSPLNLWGREVLDELLILIGIARQR